MIRDKFIDSPENSANITDKTLILLLSLIFMAGIVLITQLYPSVMHLSKYPDTLLLPLYVYITKYQIHGSCIEMRNHSIEYKKEDTCN